MKKRNFLYSLFGAGILLPIFAQSVNAQSFLPPVFQTLISGDVIRFLADRVQVFFVLFIGIFILIVIYYLIDGMRKFASDSDKSISDAPGIIQKQMVAVAGVFIGVILLAVVVIYFGFSLGQVEVNLACIEYPQSYGCFTCINEGDNPKFPRICDVCNQNENAILSGSSLSNGTKTNTNVLCKDMVIDDVTDAQVSNGLGTTTSVGGELL